MLRRASQGDPKGRLSSLFTPSSEVPENFRSDGPAAYQAAKAIALSFAFLIAHRIYVVMSTHGHAAQLPNAPVETDRPRTKTAHNLPTRARPSTPDLRLHHPTTTQAHSPASPTAQETEPSHWGLPLATANAPQTPHAPVPPLFCSRTVRMPALKPIPTPRRRASSP